MKRLLHFIAHLLHWNMGKIEDWREGEKWMMGFRCSGCGGLFHVFQHGQDGDSSYANSKLFQVSGDRVG